MCVVMVLALFGVRVRACSVVFILVVYLNMILFCVCIYIYIYVHIYIYIYRVSHDLRSLLRESVPLLKYTDITQNTYIQS